MSAPVEPITAEDAYAITPSDATVYPSKFRALWVGGAGNVAYRTLRGNTVTLTGVLAGSVLPVSGDKVMSTNTTATSIVGLVY